MSMAERVRSNAEVHGSFWSASWAYQHGVNIDTVLMALGMRLVGQS